MKLKSIFPRITNNKGMTLIEIMIVLVIVGSLLGFLGTTVMSQFRKAKKNQTKIQMGEIVKALDMYHVDCQSFPSTAQGLKALLEGPAECKNWGPDPYMKKSQLKDAFGGEFIYELDGNSYTIRSLGNDKKEGGTGADEDMSSADL
jgi:general secretion pathway protein G